MSRLVYALLLVAAPVFGGTPDATPSPPPVPPPPAEVPAVAAQTGAIYTVERSAIDALSIAEARFVSGLKEDKPHGIRVYAVRPDSTLAQMGVQNGDTLLRINNIELTVDTAKQTYEKLRRASRFTVEIERRGQPFTLQLVVGKVTGTRTAPTPLVESKPDPELERGIVCTDTGCTIERALFNKLLANTSAFAMSARFVPSMKNGQPNGFKVYAIRPYSLFAKIGFENGDTLQTINNFDLMSPDKALEAYSKLRFASTLTVGIERRGQTITREYLIR